MKLPEILAKLGLSQYEPLFEQHAIGDDLLPSLTSDDLREIGVTPLGHRKNILAAIKDLAGRHDFAAEQGDIQYRLVTVLLRILLVQRSCRKRSTPNNYVNSREPIRPSPKTPLSAMTDLSLNTLAMELWPILAIHSRMKTIPSARCVPRSICSRA